MNKFFDYIFYRAYKQYENWREDYPYPFAEGLIVVLQGFMVLSIITILSSWNIFPRKVDAHKSYALICLIALYFINHFRYKKKYIEIIKTYDTVDDFNKKRNGFLIVVFMVVVIFFPIIIGVLRNNFGYDI
jgi:amino acid permease